MTAGGCYFYCDSVTLAELRKSRSVLLIGGYQGYNNFGDILQLKGAIQWHRDQTGFDPVIICHAAALSSAGFLAKVRQWFDVRAVLVWSSELLDTSPLGLEVMKDFPRVAHLHVYGGGFLNGFWSESSLQLIESVHRQFGVGHYVLSGQQVDPAIVPRLREHVGRCGPLLAGGRDDVSVRALAESGVPSFYSFDDATEAIQVFARQFEVESDPAGAVIHLNNSGYTHESDREHEGAIASELLELSAYLGRGCGVPRVTLMAAYNDCRIDEIRDTLSVLQELEHDFPFASYDVLDLAKLALEPVRPDACTRRVVSAKIALACSYHVTLLCSILNLPCFLRAANPYYRQKLSGLGCDPASFSDFLRDPRPMPIARGVAARPTWLERMADVYKSPPAERTPAPMAAEGTARLWSPKTTHMRLQQREQMLQDLRRWAEDLQRAVTSLEDERQARMSRGEEFEAPGAQRPALAQPRDRNQVIAELKAWIAELQEAKAWLEEQWQNWMRLAQEREKFLNDQKAWSDQLQAINAELDRKVQECMRNLERQREEIERRDERIKLLESELARLVKRGGQE